MGKFSLRRLPGYLTFSENLATRYPGYMLDQERRIVPSTDHKVDLDELMGLLRSKDIEGYEKVKSKFFGKSGRYTTMQAKEQMSIVYATYPRSGNTMMRKYFENMTGITTGSD